MGQDTNIVLEGLYKGADVNFDADNGLVWVGYKKEEDCSNCFFKDVVESVQKLDETESDLRDKVHFLLGSVAAAGMSSVQDYIVLVKWKKGGESLIKVRQVVYEQILRNMTKKIPTLTPEICEIRYSYAKQDYESDNFEIVQRALEAFESIKTYKDSAEYIQKCKDKLNSPEMIAKIEAKKKKEAKNVRSAYWAILVLFAIAGCLFYLASKL